MPAALLRQLEPGDVACPAGEPVGDAGVVCRVVHEPIDGRTDPSSIESFCCGAYTTCPVWRADREADWERRRLELEEPTPKLNGDFESPETQRNRMVRLLRNLARG